jgi:2-dehydro-3-deoxygluconokinase
MKRVLCYGELLLRLTAPGRELLLQSPKLDVVVGGAEANVAVALAHLGHEARFATVVPDNALAHAALGELRRHGVDVSPIKFGPGRMGLYFLTQGAVLRPSEIVYDRAGSAFALAPDKCDITTARTDWFHISGVTPALGQKAADAALTAVRAARAAGIGISFDGNYRSKLWQAWSGYGPKMLRAITAEADVLFGDERDIALVLGQTFDQQAVADRRRAAAKAAFAAFPNLKYIAATIRVQHALDHHELSAMMFTREEACETRSYHLQGIVDRIGAGDAFTAGVLHGLFVRKSNQQSLELGLAAACLKHSIPGDFCPVSEQDLLSLLSNESLDVKR